MDDIRQRINHDYVELDGKPFESNLYSFQYILKLLSKYVLLIFAERE